MFVPTLKTTIVQVHQAMRTRTDHVNYDSCLLEANAEVARRCYKAATPCRGEAGAKGSVSKACVTPSVVVPDPKVVFVSQA